MKLAVLVLSLLLPALIHGQESQPTTLLILNVSAPVQSHKTTVINDPKAPLKIQKAAVYLATSDTEHQIRLALISRGRERYLSHLVPRPGEIIIAINAPSENVASATFGVMLYDSFYEYAGGIQAVSMKRPSSKMRFSFGRKVLTFEGFGTACIFVRKVRLNNGKIWKMDMEFVSKQMLAKKCGEEGKGTIKKRIRESEKQSQA